MRFVGLLPGVALAAGLAASPAFAAGKAKEIPVGDRILRTLATHSDPVPVNEEGRLVYGVQRDRWVYTFQVATKCQVRGHAGPKIVALLSKHEIPEGRHRDVQRGAVELWLFEEGPKGLRPVPDWIPVVLTEGYWPQGMWVAPQLRGDEAYAFFCDFVHFDKRTKPRHRIREGVLLYPLHGQFHEVFRTVLEDNLEHKDARLDQTDRAVLVWKDLDQDKSDELLISRTHRNAEDADRTEIKALKRGVFEVYVWVPDKADQLDRILESRRLVPDRLRDVPIPATDPLTPLPTPTEEPKEYQTTVVAKTYSLTYAEVYERRGWYLARTGKWVRTDPTSGAAIRTTDPPLLSMKYVPGMGERAIQRAYSARDAHPIDIRSRTFTETGAGHEEGARLHLHWNGSAVWCAVEISDDKVIEAQPWEKADVDALEIGLCPQHSDRSFGTPVRLLVRLDRSDKHGAWFHPVVAESSADFSARAFQLPWPRWLQSVPRRLPDVRPGGVRAAGWMQPGQWGLAEPTVAENLGLPQPSATGPRSLTYLDTIYEVLVPWSRLGWGGVLPEFMRFYTIVVDVDEAGGRPRHVVPFPNAPKTLDINDPSTWAAAVVEY